MRITSLVRILLLAVCTLLVFSPAVAQQTTGGIQGIVRDTTGGVLPGAEVTITDPATGREIPAITNDSGLYVVRSLPAAEYQVQASLTGFKTSVRTVVVLVGQMATADMELEVGQITEVITVTSNIQQVDTATNTVSGTVTANIIRDLPLNGRNFLDLAQTEPGVQLVDGGTFDPTKNQMVGVSVGGRSGRVTRITVDGIDISDETVGTTTQNLSPDAVQEFQISQSSLDPSTSLTSSGAVNIITKSGSNELHGSAFVFYRDEEVAALPTTRTGDPVTDANLNASEFDREQGGFEVGGPMVKDHLFFFVNYETLNQDGTTFISNANFPANNQGVGTPFDDHLGLGRLDWQVNDATTAFFRFSHETNSAATGFGGVNLAPFINQNVSNILATGFDVATARLTHSFRFGHSSFDNEISTDSLGLPEFQAANGIPVSLALNSRRAFFSGPNRLAPQATYQTNFQYKYDGGWVNGNHTIRYGAEVNWIKVNLFASFFGVGPEVRGNFTSDDRDDIIARGGNPADPTEYPVSFALIGNGLGAFTEIANNGRDTGGINNTRIAWYVADSWRINPNFNLNMSLRYEINTGQVNDDLPLPSEFATVLGADGVRPTQLDKNNFGPQIGFAWQPFGNGRTVIRGGAGIFYETNIFNSAIFDRTNRIPEGLGFNIAFAPLSNIDDQGRVLVSGVPVNNIDTRDWSGAPFNTVIDQIGQTQADFQAAWAQVAFDPNGTPSILSALTTSIGPVIAQDYETPYGIQTNIGIQHEVADNWVLSVDYMRNRNVHHNLVRDFNRVGAADTLDVAAASEAVASTLADEGWATIDDAIAAGASIGDFLGTGLSVFGGMDPTFANVEVIMSSGISTYNGLQTRLVGRLGQVEALGLRDLFLNLNYSLSEFEGISEDQDFIPRVAFTDGYLDKRNFGPAGWDRTHQLTAQLSMGLPAGFKVNLNSRWASGFPATPNIQDDSIFTTDLNGDGNLGGHGDPEMLPGASRGVFGRGVDGEELNGLISAYNSSTAGQITPAGQALVTAGLFTEAQLKALEAVAPEIPLAPAGQLGNDSFITQDIRIAKVFNVGGERVQIQPMVEIFNIFNIANFGGPAGGSAGNPPSLEGRLTGLQGSINGTVEGQRANLFGVGSGGFSQGIPRSFQFGLRVDF